MKRWLKERKLAEYIGEPAAAPIFSKNKQVRRLQKANELDPQSGEDRNGSSGNP
jgi:hypothetical protein